MQLISTPSTPWRGLIVQKRTYVAFSANPKELPEPVGGNGWAFRKLSDQELADPEKSDGLYVENRERYAQLGFNEAYGVFDRGELAHVSWLISPKNEAKTGPRVLGLRRDEMEITACGTAPKFRGAGMYPYAIRCLCRIADGRGIRRVFMKTTPENDASQKGIRKAGLQPHGRIVYISSPLLWRVGVAYRGHRHVRPAVVKA